MTLHKKPRPVSVGQLIRARQKEKGITDLQLSGALESTDTKVIRLIKSDALRLPMKNLFAVARVLEIDAADLLLAVLSQSDPDLLDVVEEITGPLSDHKASKDRLMNFLAAEHGVEQDMDPSLAGRSVGQIADEGKVRLTPTAGEAVPGEKLDTPSPMRIHQDRAVPASVAMLDKFGDPLMVSAFEARIVYAYRAAGNGKPGTATLVLPRAVVLVVPRAEPVEG